MIALIARRNHGLDLCTQNEHQGSLELIALKTFVRGMEYRGVHVQYLINIGEIGYLEAQMIYYLKQAFSWLDSKQKTGVQIVLIMGLIVCSYAGVLAGLHRDWFYMVFFFFIFIFTAHCNVGFLMDLKMDACFKQLENVISRKSNSVQLGSRLIFRALTIFTVVSTAVMISLSILAGLRQRWLMLGVILVAFTVTNYMSTGVTFALRIKAYSRHLEELICQTRGDEEPKELSDK